MHELGIAFYIIDMVEDLGRQNDLTSVARVWRWAADRTDLMRAAELEIESVPAITRCLDCDQTYATVEYGRTCPYCASEKTELIQGLELELDEIEAT